MVADLVVAPGADDASDHKAGNGAGKQRHFRAVYFYVGQARIGVAAVVEHFGQLDAQIGYGAGHVGGADGAAGEHGHHGVVHAHDKRQKQHGRRHHRAADMRQRHAQQAEQQKIQRFHPHRQRIAAVKTKTLGPQDNPARMGGAGEISEHARERQQAGLPAAERELIGSVGKVAGDVRSVAGHRKETAGVDRPRQERHQIAQQPETEVRNRAVVQIGLVCLPEWVGNGFARAAGAGHGGKKERKRRFRCSGSLKCGKTAFRLPETRRRHFSICRAARALTDIQAGGYFSGCPNMAGSLKNAWAQTFQAARIHLKAA